MSDNKGFDCAIILFDAFLTNRFIEVEKCTMIVDLIFKYWNK